MDGVDWGIFVMPRDEKRSSLHVDGGESYSEVVLDEDGAGRKGSSEVD